MTLVNCKAKYALSLKQRVHTFLKLTMEFKPTGVSQYWKNSSHPSFSLSLFESEANVFSVSIYSLFSLS